ncbi:MAG TPA: glycoside hydrolase family 16 protein [Gaiellaceae bacterium]|nr:glycoside hydrolase family 16 protein [Gaiellaceae bacterium]
MRVSSFQTGTRDGQHRFADGLVVREPQETVQLHVPQYASIELRARATDDDEAMCALWLIGFEDEPEHSAEICVCEIFGRDVRGGEAVVGMGVHPFGDPSIVDEFERVTLPIDACAFNVYRADWSEERVEFFVNGELVKTVEQSPAYPMQLMLSLYAFGAAGAHPKVFEVDYVRSRPAIRRRASQMPPRPSASR